MCASCAQLYKDDDAEKAMAALAAAENGLDPRHANRALGDKWGAEYERQSEAEVARLKQELEDALQDAKDRVAAAETAEVRRKALVSEAAHVSDEAAGLIESVMSESSKWALEARRKTPEQAAHLEFMAKTMAACGREALEPGASAAQRCQASEMARLCSAAMLGYAQARARRAEHRATDLEANLRTAQEDDRHMRDELEQKGSITERIELANAAVEAQQRVLERTAQRITRVCARGALTRPVSPPSRDDSHDRRVSSGKGRRRSSGGGGGVHTGAYASVYASPSKLKDGDLPFASLDAIGHTPTRGGRPTPSGMRPLDLTGLHSHQRSPLHRHSHAAHHHDRSYSPSMPPPLTATPRRSPLPSDLWSPSEEVARHHQHRRLASRPPHRHTKSPPPRQARPSPAARAAQTSPASPMRRTSPARHGSPPGRGASSTSPALLDELETIFEASLPTTLYEHNDILIRTRDADGNLLPAASEGAWAALLSASASRPLFLLLDGRPSDPRALLRPYHRLWLYGAAGESFAAFHLGGERAASRLADRLDLSTHQLFSAAVEESSAGEERVRRVRIVAPCTSYARHAALDDEDAPAEPSWLCV